MYKKPITAAFVLFLSLIAKAQYNFAALDSLFRQSLAQSGAAVIIAKDGKVVYSKTFSNFTTSKPIPIASASKWYAALVIMRLADKGILSLDDKVSKYIPAFNTADKSAITIRQCFSHTAGMAEKGEGLDEYMPYTNYEAMVNAIAQAPLKAKPGTEFAYGGVSMQVAGRVAEIASGKSWNQLFNEEVVQPLGLKRTFYLGAQLGRVPRIAGGGVSTAEDYMIVLNMLYNKGMYEGKRYLSLQSIHSLLSDETNGAVVAYSPFTKYNAYLHFPEPKYGIGNWILMPNKSLSDTIYTSPGAFGFTPWLVPQKNYYAVIAVRSSGPLVMPVFLKAAAILDKMMQ